MEKTALKHTLNKLKVSEFLKVLEKWKFLKRNNLTDIDSIVHGEAKRKSKLSVVADLIEFCQVKLQFNC